MSALLIIHRTNEGQITNIPFTYRDGHLVELIEEIADVMAGMGISGGVWEGVAAAVLTFGAIGKVIAG